MNAQRLAVSALVLLGALACPVGTRAEHFDITLDVKTALEEAHASWDTEPPIGGVNPRPVAHAQVGEPIQIEWEMRSAYPHGVMKQVTVHFFVVQEQAIAQKAVPELDVPRLAESEFVLDYRPDYAAKGSVLLHVEQPGLYLVRLQSENTIKDHDHEHFSAIDLEVK
jgi:hypothetical protein